MSDHAASTQPLIFLIDDVTQNLQVLSEVLRQEGFRISGAGSGPAALRMLQQLQPDLILCDIMMPEMDGYEVAQRLKNDPKTQDIPLIFLTARNESEDIVKGFAAGGVDYITKPFNNAELLARVNNHLELKRARDTIAENARHLAALNAEKDQILNIAAHDLKNPLTNIMLRAEMIQMRKAQMAPEKLLEYANYIYHDADRMLLIITNLLDVNRIESGRIQPQWQEASLEKIFKRLQTAYQPQAEKKDVKLVCPQLDPSLSLRTDSLLLYQLLDNLLSNALKFSESGKTVWMRAVETEAGLQIEIEDQGPGFSEQDQSQMFQKFARLSAQPTAGENSTGLGLAIVSYLAELLQVKLSYATEPCQGTCFKLLMPCFETPAAEA